MPQLNWDATDFMECLEVALEVENFEFKYVYEVRKDGLVLVVTVWPIESVIQLSLRQREVDTSLIAFALFVRDAACYIKDRRGEYLEFKDCVVAPSRFSYQGIGDVFDKANFNHGSTIQLVVKPHLQIRYV